MPPSKNIVIPVDKGAYQETPDNKLNKLIELELIHTLYRNFPLPLTASVVFAMIVAWTFWAQQSHSFLLGWLGAILFLSALRGLFLYQFSRLKPGANTIRKWAWLFTVGALLSGLVWGALPWLILDTSSTFNTLFVILAMLGIIAATMGTHAAFLPAYFSFAIPVAVLLASRLELESSGFHVFTYMMVLFLVVFLFSSTNYCHLMKASIRQRFEKMDLIRALEIKNREAETANRDKSRFLAATSHDLRQPLHALDLYLAALSRSPDQQERRQLTAQARLSSKALGELLNALLDISQLDTGAVEARICTTSLPEIIREVAGECVPVASDKGLQMRWHIPSRCEVQTDPVLFQCMLRNLISNAIRYSTEGGVLVGVRNRNGLARVQVYDTGPGIPEHQLEQIFSEFHQLDNPERDRSKGLGLGLAIVRKLSLLLNHPVHAHSRPGRGSCFSIDLPMRKVEDAYKQTAASENEATDVSGLFVLVVDDDRTILNATCAWLRSMGCEVLLAESWNDALAELKQHPYPVPDVIVSDYRLRSQLSGIDVVDSARGYFASRIPAIIISGDISAETTSLAHDAECYYLKKPAQEASLLKLLMQIAHSGPD